MARTTCLRISSSKISSELEVWCNDINAIYQRKIEVLTKLRDKIKRQAKALNIIRKLHVRIANRIVAIDAANTEIGTRPEVFAQAFRYLKKYSHEDENYQFLNRKRNTLCFTYHVGEDFLDLADGLRAIDEVIKFLQFSRGDRLGHAIALAVNPSLYYTRRSYQVVMPKMDLLDNIVWLLMQVRKFNISISQALLQKMEELYWKLFCEIYTDIEGFDILMPFEIYYQSWLLRGDNPYLYLNKDFNLTSENISKEKERNHPQQKIFFIILPTKTIKNTP